MKLLSCWNMESGGKQSVCQAMVTQNGSRINDLFSFLRWQLCFCIYTELLRLSKVTSLRSMHTLQAANTSPLRSAYLKDVCVQEWWVWGIINHSKWLKATATSRDRLNCSTFMRQNATTLKGREESLQVLYNLRVKRSHLSKVYNHKGEPPVAKICFSIEANKQITTVSCHE